MPPQFSAYPQHIRALWRAALAAADPATAVAHHLRLTPSELVINHLEPRYRLGQGRIFLVSVGKAALPMAQAAAAILGRYLHAGLVIAKNLPATPPPLPDNVAVYRGNHPVSGPESIQATTAVHHLLQQTGPADLVLCLISGGASALLTQPHLSLADWQALSQALLACGCPIDDFNTVRRQLDGVKGGGLARWAAPATCLSLILSDVVGNPLPYIGSGPTVPGADTPADALAVLRRYGLADLLDTAVYQRILQALQTPPPTPQPDQTIANLIIGDVRLAATAALETAADLGFTPQLLTARLEGEAREIGRVAAAIAQDAPPHHCLILGGETTVTLRGAGLGGRNLETALAAAISLAGVPGVALASLATDGEDGPTDAAGALVTGETAVYAHQRQLNPLDYLHRNDSYHFFQKLDQAAGHNQPATLFQPGPTGVNVNDLIIILTYADTQNIINP